ncbi:MAG: ECF transporter S component [Oscillospiraceae bacterium]|nr:ECF transporter S component [Oscillospiraceae bacterium]
MKSKSHAHVRYLTRLSLLFAIVVILTVFNIGNIPIGPVVATVYQVPVIIGAVVLGVGAGCFLGGAWGILCFYLAITGQTTDVVALAVVQQNPLLYLSIAFVPRLLTGLFSGLIAKGMKKLFGSKLDVLGYGITGIAGSLTNTVLYLGALFILIRELLATLFEIEIGAVGAMVLGVALTNGLIEAVVSCLIVATASKILIRFLPDAG